MSIVYFVENKLGGITSLNYNLVNNAPKDADSQYVIHIDDEGSETARANIRFNADQEVVFTYSGKQGIYETVRKLHDLLPKEAGALVLNDCLEMQMLDHYPVAQTVYQIVHDEYNFKLALTYPHVVDVFVAHSIFFYDKLIEAFPGRRDVIFYLPHGVKIPDIVRRSSTPGTPIRLLFLGRMTESKGIFDLPAIDRYLEEWGIARSWTCVGRGPELQDLQRQWSANPAIHFAAPAGNEEVIAICASNDIFVLPTRFEGSPVSLLETMSVGLVPVISDLPGGIREIVTGDIGFRPAMKDSRAFAESIRTLSSDKQLLDALSNNCRKMIEQQFDVRKTAQKYHELFGKYRQFYKTKQLQRRKIGTRLDQPWLPSGLTSLIRKIRS
jgi:glycosyltransferase involved in cell wall biosynthesis